MIILPVHPGEAVILSLRGESITLLLQLLLDLVELIKEGHCGLIRVGESLVFLPQRLRNKLLRVLKLPLHTVVRDELALVLLEHTCECEPVHSHPPHEVNHVHRAGHVPLNLLQL